MRKQSSKIYYNGQLHHEIYFNGHYHDKMYKGSELVWEKLGDEPTPKDIGGSIRCVRTNGLNEVYALVEWGYPYEGHPGIYVMDKLGIARLEEDGWHVIHNIGNITENLGDGYSLTRMNSFYLTNKGIILGSQYKLNIPYEYPEYRTEDFMYAIIDRQRNSLNFHLLKDLENGSDLFEPTDRFILIPQMGYVGEIVKNSFCYVDASGYYVGNTHYNFDGSESYLINPPITARVQGIRGIVTNVDKMIDTQGTWFYRMYEQGIPSGITSEEAGEAFGLYDWMALEKAKTYIPFGIGYSDVGSAPIYDVSLRGTYQEAQKIATDGIHSFFVGSFGAAEVVDRVEEGYTYYRIRRGQSVYRVGYEDFERVYDLTRYENPRTPYSTIEDVNKTGLIFNIFTCENMVLVTGNEGEYFYGQNEDMRLAFRNMQKITNQNIDMQYCRGVFKYGDIFCFVVGGGYDDGGGSYNIKTGETVEIKFVSHV